MNMSILEKCADGMDEDGARVVAQCCYCPACGFREWHWVDEAEPPNEKITPSTDKLREEQAGQPYD